MRRSHALRHLLLRRLWRIQGAADASTYEEVTRSLKIDNVDGGFIASWNREGRVHEQRFTAEDFTLYARGDFASAAGADGKDARNDELAASFACEALGIPPGSRVSRPRSLFPNAPVTLAGALLLSMAFTWAAGPATGLLLASLCILEYAGTKAKTACALLMGTWAVLGLPNAAALGAATYGALQFLDPNPDWRVARVVAAAIALAMSLILGFHAPTLDAVLAITLVLSAATFLTRWLYGTHFRSMPLVLPFLCLGFYLDGRGALAAVGLTGAFASVIFARWGGKLFPLRRQEEAFKHTMTHPSAASLKK